MSDTVTWALHGFLGLPSDWKGFKVKAVEVEAHPDMESWAETFNTSVRAAGATKNRLVGYSMGGRLALHAKALDPDLWEKVWVISAHPGLKSEHQERLQKDEAWARRFEEDEWYALMKDWMSQPVFKDSRAPLRLPSDFKRNDLAAFLRNYSLGRQKITPPDSIEWVVGERDALFKALLPQAKVVPNAGHRVLFDNPEALKRMCAL